MSESGPMQVTRRMLWNRVGDEQSRQQPIVVLHGPVGSGKTHALDTIAGDLDWGVVHARFDFDRDPTEATPATLVVLMTLVYRLSIKWRRRATPRFNRFAIALVAIQTPLDGLDRPAARKKLEKKIKDLDRSRRENLEHLLTDLIATPGLQLVQPAAAGVLTPLLKSVLPPLIREVRPRLRKVLRSLADNTPQAVAGALDALVTLNELARDTRQQAQKEVTAWLVEAFLADVRENHKRMSKPDLTSPCTCANPERVRHRHNWVVMLDNVDHSGGLEFLKDLTDARKKYRERHPEDRLGHDGLLVVATSGRWLDWDGWLPPWRPGARLSGSRAVRSCAEATYQDWAEQPEKYFASAFYPVTLDALRVEEVAEVLDTSPRGAKARLVRQASAGLPRAVVDIREATADKDTLSGAREILGAGWSSDDPEKTPYPRLARLRLNEHLAGVEIDDIVTAAPFATAPWLVPVDESERGPTGQPHLGQILTELRTALWVTARDAAGGFADHPTLHPWVAANLMSALACRHAGPSHDERFAALRDDPHTEQDSVRQVYCQLALGKFTSVVTWFEKDFDRVPHRDWLDHLELVVRAPDHAVRRDRDDESLYNDLVNDDLAHKPSANGRTEIRSNVARLLAASWLAASPFAVRHEKQNTVIDRSLQALARATGHADVSPLVDAANRAQRGQWP